MIFIILLLHSIQYFPIPLRTIKPDFEIFIQSSNNNSIFSTQPYNQQYSITEYIKNACEVQLLIINSKFEGKMLYFSFLCPISRECKIRSPKNCRECFTNINKNTKGYST